MSNDDYQIVTINVSQTVGAIPSTLQQTGAFVSTGATTLGPGKTALITQKSDLTALVNIPITALAVVSNVLNVTLSTPLPASYAVGTTLALTITGAYPAAYNGTFTATVTSSTKLTAPFAQTVTAATTLGYAQLPGAKELLAMGTTWFAQGANLSVYVLELGAASAVKDSVTALSTYIDAPVLQFYAYLVPRAWEGVPEFITLTGNHATNESLLYFFITVTAGPVNLYAGIKSAITMVQDVAAPDTECSVASIMRSYLSASPSDINKVPPMAFRFLLGVTKYSGSGPAKKQLTQNFINYVGTGAEGGISNTLVMNGVSSDGRDMTYWYSVDWIQINSQIALANEIINGSNNPINPLYYEQKGIERLQNRAQIVFNSGVTFGLVNGNPEVQAVPFRTYIKNNPNDYEIGRYAGLSAEYTPMRGFTKIVFNINVTMQLS